MRFLGIDYGKKRIGIAISDENGTLAFPKTIIKNDDHVLSAVADILRCEKIQEVVIGESLDYNGNPNEVWEEAKEFMDNLKGKIEVVVHKEKEFFTTVEARKTQGSKKKVDASAAALILQRYLDKLNNKKYDKY